MGRPSTTQEWVPRLRGALATVDPLAVRLFAVACRTTFEQVAALHGSIC